MRPWRSSAILVQIVGALGAFHLEAGGVEVLRGIFRTRPTDAFFLVPLQSERGRLFLGLGQLFPQRPEAAGAGVVFFLGEGRSPPISSWSTRRVSSSSSCGRESISVRIMAQASSTRSIALSGRKRSENYSGGKAVTAETSAASWMRHAVGAVRSAPSARAGWNRVLDRWAGRPSNLAGNGVSKRGVLFRCAGGIASSVGGADAVQFRRGRAFGLREIASVHRALGLAGADDVMELVDEKQNAAVALA